MKQRQPTHIINSIVPNSGGVELMLENPEIPLPFRIQTVGLKALGLEFKP
jgi:hypothetical protein